MKVMILMKYLKFYPNLKKNKKILIGKYKDIIESPDFEQDYYSRTVIGI